MEDLARHSSFVVMKSKPARHRSRGRQKAAPTRAPRQERAWLNGWLPCLSSVEADAVGAGDTSEKFSRGFCR